MTIAELAEYNLFSCLEKSHLLDVADESKIWFAQLNLQDCLENELPDAGQIADYLFSEIELPEIQLFLLLIERNRIESWSGNSKTVGFQELVEIKNNNVYQKISKQH